MKLWLDDIRKPPDTTWTWVKTADEAIAELKKGEVAAISFDHDLCHSASKVEKTGYTVACWIEQRAYMCALPKMSWSVHSGNPVGAEKIKRAMESADRLWSREKCKEK